MTEATAPSGTGDAGAAAAAPTATAAPASAPASGGTVASAAPTTATVGESAPAAPAAPATPAATLAQGGEPPAPAVAATAAPTPSWQERVSGGDKEFLKMLERFPSEADFGKAYREQRRKISEGAHKKPGPPENATTEALAEWRKEAGIPESPDKYEVKLPQGLVLGTEDQPVVDLFKQHAHKRNMPVSEFNDTLTWYYETQDALRSMRTDADQQFSINAQEFLRREWEGDYKRNFNAMGNLRDKMPEGLSDRLLAGRMADGTVIGNDPTFIQWMVSTALDLDPHATLLPAGTANAGASIDAEIAEINKLIQSKTDAHLYWKDEAKQKRYRELLAAQEHRKTRAA